MCFFFCLFLYFSQVLGRIFTNLVGRLRAAPDISSRDSFLKVKVIEVKGQISVSPRSLGRSSPNMEGTLRVATDISLRGSFFERSRSSRSKVKFMCFFFSVCSPTSPK